MARTFSRSSQNYAAGVYGPFQVDGLTSADTSRVEWTLSVEDWPVDATPAVSVLVRWSNGTEWRDQYNGLAMGRDGVRATVVGGSVDVPMVAGSDGKPRKRDVVSGEITVTAHVPIRTAVTFNAI